MGGALTAESRVGEGSRFTCSIPVIAVEAPVTAAAGPGESATPSCPGMRVLAADDNPVNRAVLEASLARLGIDVVSVEDGAKALDAFKNAVHSGPFDLVFMDCSMPVMDGYAAARAIRSYEAEQAEALDATPIVALTADVIGQTVLEWQKAGMSDFLAKPFTLAELTDVVLRWRKTPAATATQAVTIDAEPSVPTPEAPAAAVLDIEIFDQIGRMDRDGKLVTRLVRLYREQAAAMGPKLLSMLETGDRPEIGRLAHALKSMSLSLGARAVSDIVSDLEARANLGGEIDAERDGAEFSRALEATLVALDDAVQSKQAGPKTVARSA
jgi:two-component system sensor histidine kinase BarA